ncbi:n2,N2-dimethylguanosine tRNA methyltransferase domain-containing protein [Ditylenchus destructor]|uniref:tRNA (guanine(26)-N(2))-dimethyltransferase n=1 Tax=Ditylenchus destructor TaxID=166010 RepID=A0AAD4NEV9_9BILA|nr:n2,N2-dimethylguanosine tRNA methyltransferase domain-containing protein [Ditylenchus destructor]
MESSIENKISTLHESNGSDGITEGKVTIVTTGAVKTFYNPVQEFNRDLTICVLRQFFENSKGASTGNHNAPIRVLDALSASGLRALRFAKEVPGIDNIMANDFSETAVVAIKNNAKANNVEHLVHASYGDAVDVMMSHRTYDKRFHAIDLDPYGSASVFLDSAVQAVTDDGILMVTCTDMATLCGNAPEACFSKYGSIPLRHKSCHEFALRILLRTIESHANKYGRYIKPLLCVSIDFYIRCFVQLGTGAYAAKDSVTKLSHVLACGSCNSLGFQPLFKKVVSGNNEISNASRCVHCGGKSIHMAGPIYTAPIHNQEFVAQLLQRLKNTAPEDRLGTHNRLEGVLTVVSEEIHDVPLYYEYGQLMSVVRCPVPKLVTVRSALLNAGYRCSISHCNPNALKTDAPVQFLWDICRTWAKSHNKVADQKGQPIAKFILSTPNTFNVNFTTNPKAIIRSRNETLVRFQDNKGKNWGPKSKAKGSVNSSTASFQHGSQSSQKAVHYERIMRSVIEKDAFIPNTEQLVNQFALLSDEHMAKWLVPSLFHLGYCLGCPIAQFIVASTLNPKSIVLVSMLLTTLCVLGSAMAFLLWAFILLQCITGFLAGAVFDWSHHTNQVFVSNYLIGARCLSTFALAVSLKYEQDLAQLLFNDEFYTWRQSLLYETIILAVLLCFVFISTKPSPRWVLESDRNMEKYNRLAKEFFNASKSSERKILDNDLTEELSQHITNSDCDIEPISCALKMNRLLILYGAIF